MSKDEITALAGQGSGSGAAMPAYLIARVKVNDAEIYGGYTALSPAIIAAHGGRFLSRGQAPTTLEGPEERRRMVIVEFPDMNHALAFYESPEYQAAKAIRWPVSEGEFVLLPSSGS